MNYLPIAGRKVNKIICLGETDLIETKGFCTINEKEPCFLQDSFVGNTGLEPVTPCL